MADVSIMRLERELSLKVARVAHLERIALPFDSGLSAARNALLERVETEFVALLDDDFVFDARTDIGALLRVLRESPDRIDIAAGSLQLAPLAERDALVAGADGKFSMRVILMLCSAFFLSFFLSCFFFFFFFFALTLVAQTVAPPSDGWPEPYAYAELLAESADGAELQLRRGSHGGVSGFADVCSRHDIVLNFFVARADALRRVRWDAQLKLGEHQDFFLRARDAGLRVASCPTLAVALHVQDHSDSNYKRKRMREFLYLRRMLEKHNYRRMRLSTGPVYVDLDRV